MWAVVNFQILYIERSPYHRFDNTAQVPIIVANYLHHFKRYLFCFMVTGSNCKTPTQTWRTQGVRERL